MEGYKSPYGPKDDFGYREEEDALGLDEQEQALWNKARSEDERFAIMEQRDERRLKEHQEQERQEWPTTRAGQLLKKLGECFAEYKKCLEHDPRLVEKALDFDEMNQKIFNRMRTTMERAHQAPRCRHPRVGGGTCRAPRVRGKKSCHMPEMPEDAPPPKKVEAGSDWWSQQLGKPLEAA
jgi:hypothetical protein